MATREQIYQAIRNADAAGDGESVQKLAAYLKTMPQESETPKEPIPQPTMTDKVKQGAGDLVAGAVRGAGSIGATILSPVDAAARALGVQNEWIGRTDRRQAMDEGLRSLGADPESLMFKGGKLGGEIAGTAGVGGVLAKPVTALATAVPAVARFASPLASALETGGFKLGQTVNSAPVNALTRIVGGAATGGAAAGLADPAEAGKGAVIGGVLPPAVQVAAAGGRLVRSGLEAGATKLMQSAIKPTIKQLGSGDAAIASQVMLDNGISLNGKGVNKLRELINDLNSQIGEKIAGSDAVIDKNKVMSALGDTRSKFLNQVNPETDLGVIQKVADDFANHPYFQNIEAQGPALEEALQKASLGKAQALQAAGKLKTFAAQQENLAHGGGISLSPAQSADQLYFNVGKTGGTALSPSAYPLMDMPRIAGRYTHNIDRVPEGLAGYEDAMAAFAARKADEDAARVALEQWQASRGNLPVQVAQKLKQGTYNVLSGKYGEVGSAATEAQKALARGLKNEIAEAVPGIAELNARESALLKALPVVERRALMDLNKNPMGLAALASNPLSWAAFMADRSAPFKALAARMVNRTAGAAEPAALMLEKGGSNPLLRNAAVLSVSGE